MFNAISTSGTGLQTYHTWLDTISNNIANVNDESATSGNVFHEEYMQASANGTDADGVGTGVHVAGVTASSENGIVVQDPGNPLADANGDVRRADVNLSDQMGDMIMAQRAFQANAANISRVKDAYTAAINIGKGI
jgi:flagellar basal-body rod protein FlgC